jgi:hypothetical protein
VTVFPASWFNSKGTLVLLAITLLTIGYQALKAASMNPVETLRSE